MLITGQIFRWISPSCIPASFSASTQPLGWEAAVNKWPLCCSRQVQTTGTHAPDENLQLLSCKSAEISKPCLVRCLTVIWCRLMSLWNYTFRHMWARVPASVRPAALLPVSDAAMPDTTPSASLLRAVCLRPALPFEAPPPVPQQPYCNSAPDLYPITFLANSGTTCNLR